MELDLQERVVIVTGASGGIGAAIARAYGREGAAVTVAYHRNRDAADKVVAEVIEAGGQAVASPHDLADSDAGHALAEATLAAFGRIDVLVNNAVQWPRRGPGSAGMETVPDDDWVQTLRVNIEGPVRAVRAVLPTMRAAGFGRLVHVSSNIALDGMQGSVYYGAAKAALHGMNRSLAWEVGDDGILTNVVLPGLTWTDRAAQMIPAEAAEQERRRTPKGALNSPEDVAALVVFLGSPANSGLTGEAVPVTGGR